MLRECWLTGTGSSAGREGRLLGGAGAAPTVACDPTHARRRASGRGGNSEAGERMRLAHGRLTGCPDGLRSILHVRCPPFAALVQDDTLPFAALAAKGNVASAAALPEWERVYLFRRAICGLTK